MEGNVDAQNPWNTSQIKKWLECKPVELEKYRLEKYFYLTRENLKRSSIDESGFSKNTKFWKELDELNLVKWWLL